MLNFHRPWHTEKKNAAPVPHTLAECIALCRECREVCQQALFQHCLKRGGRHLEEAHVKRMADCIQFCEVAADFMVRGSKFHASICTICGDICEACAESCEAITSEPMQHCADICWRCAESCHAMSEMPQIA